MKLLTLNTHSLVEENYTQKLYDFVKAVSKEQPQIIALQEVNQTAFAAAVPAEKLNRYFPADSHAVIRKDNHAYNAVRLLEEKGVPYFWTWIPLKLGYGRYDEGLAVMSLSPIIETSTPLVSEVNDYHNWKTRKLLGIRTELLPREWFYSVHFGWWDDEEEPFIKQWAKTESHMMQHECVWLMGDFNSPAEVRGEGYDKILGSCWQDSFVLSKRKDIGYTVGKVIDGWKDKISKTCGMRIDQIWCSEKKDIQRSEVLFNGTNYPVISDHYGVMAEYTEGDNA